MCRTHMELLVIAILNVLVEKLHLHDDTFTPSHKFHNLSQYATWTLSHKIPKYTNKQYISTKTDIIKHNKEWDINIRGKLHGFTSYEMM